MSSLFPLLLLYCFLPLSSRHFFVDLFSLLLFPKYASSDLNLSSILCLLQSLLRTLPSSFLPASATSWLHFFRLFHLQPFFQPLSPPDFLPGSSIFNISSKLCYFLTLSQAPQYSFFQPLPSPGSLLGAFIFILSSSLCWPPGYLLSSFIFILSSSLCYLLALF